MITVRFRSGPLAWTTQQIPQAWPELQVTSDKGKVGTYRRLGQSASGTWVYAWKGWS